LASPFNTGFKPAPGFKLSGTLNVNLKKMLKEMNATSESKEEIIGSEMYNRIALPAVEKRRR